MKNPFLFLVAIAFAFSLQLGVLRAQGVVSVSPAQNALNVPRTTNISVVFSEAMNVSTLTNANIRVWGSSTGLVTCAFTYDPGTFTLVMDPVRDFAWGEGVKVVVTDRMRTAGGQAIAKFLWGFSVQANTAPAVFGVTGAVDVGNYPDNVAAGDFDGDGDLDLAVANSGSNTVSILINNGSGGFTQASAVGVGSNPFGITTGDFDGDGDLDLAVTNQNSITVSILLNNGNGGFTQASTVGVGSHPRGITTGDFDGDGDLDLAVANFTPNNVSILTNNGNGGFIQASTVDLGPYPYGIITGDFDSDGDLDLAVSINFSNTVYILINNGNGSFTQASTVGVSYPYGIITGDFDGDGDLDLAVTNSSSNTVSILLNNGNGGFTQASTVGVGSYPIGITTGDFDGDGDLDLAVTNSSSNTVSILVNNGNGGFTQASTVGVASNPQGITMGDFDGDGDLDLAVANYGSNTVSILRNTVFYASVANLDFGNTFISFPRDSSITLFNISSDPITVTNIASSSPRFTLLGPVSFSIAPNSSRAVTVRYSPTAAVLDTGRLIITPSGLPQEVVTLRGTGVTPVPVIGVSPTSLPFGSATVGRTADMILTVVNLGVLDLHITNIANSNSRFTIVGSTSFTLLPGESEARAVRFSPTALGAQSDTLRISSDDPTNSVVRVPMSGTGSSSQLPDISIQPLQLRFSSVTIGAADTLTLRVYNLGGANLTVTGVTSNHVAFVPFGTLSFALPPGDSTAFSVRFSPTQARIQQGLLSIVSNDPNENPLEVRVQGFGIPPLPSVPTLVYPPNDSTGQPTNITLCWRVSAWAERYHIQVVENPPFGNRIVDDSTATDTLYYVGGLQNNVLHAWRVKAKNITGESDWSEVWNFTTVITSVDDDLSGIPRKYSLAQNFPNPFNPSTTISFDLPVKSFVSLRVFDILGREVYTVVSEELPAGNYLRQWNAAGMPSGVYFYRLQAGSYTQTRKLILLR